MQTMDSQPITPPAISPATSMEAFPPSTQAPADDSLPSTQESQESREQGKYGSTPPPSSSMTPPPSSQPPRRAPVSNKTDGTFQNHSNTPKPPAYSSPPPTTMDSAIRRDVGIASGYVQPSQTVIAQSSRNDLEAMLLEALADRDRLDMEAREARMAAAHFKLQGHLGRIDAEETIKRMEVEHEMTRREVDALLIRDARAEPAIDYEYVTKLKNYCLEITEDLDLSNKRLQKAKRAIKSKDEVISQLKEDNGFLLERIRQNRAHLSQLRSPGGIFAATTPRTFPSTPQQYRSTPKHTPATNRSRVREGSQEPGPFQQLLLADKMLKDRALDLENSPNSAPSTPILSRMPIKRHQQGHGHTRAAHSLSSLPTTPVRSSYAANSDGALLPAAQFVAQSEPRYRVSAVGSFSQQHSAPPRRHKSRDSTISASDGEGGYVGDGPDGDSEEEEIEESQASRSATAMLRRDPRESFEVVGTPSMANTPTSEVGAKSNLLQAVVGAPRHPQQAKIYGTITKPGAEKRKRGSDTGSRSPQKARKLGEGVGLGIGGWESQM